MCETNVKVWAFKVHPESDSVISIFAEPWDASDPRLSQPEYVARPLLALGGDCDFAWHTYVAAQRTEQGGFHWTWRPQPRIRWDGEILDLNIALPELKALALRRIRTTPSLAPYEEILLYEGWPEQAQHLIWIVTASWHSVWKWADAVETSLALYDMFEAMAQGEIVVLSLEDLSDGSVTL